MIEEKMNSITAILLDEMHKTFDNIRLDQIKGTRKNPIKLTDCLMSALAMFQLKFPSLLQFDQYTTLQKNVMRNLVRLYGMSTIPSDTYMRERLDELDPNELRRAFTSIFSFLQDFRNKFKDLI